METPSLKSVKLTEEFNDATNTEGWGIFDADGVYRIQKIDDVEEIGPNVPELYDDNVAIELCVKHASHASLIHLCALYLDGQEVNSGYKIPKSFLQFFK